MRKFGLIGFPLSHSYSVGYFKKKFKIENIFDCEYQNFPIESISLLPDIIRGNPDLYGLNVTIPYKEEVLAYLDSIEPDAARVGAVNTLKITRKNDNPYIRGFNTDIYGFSESLKELSNRYPKKALILGTGGASKAVAYSLDQMGISYLFVSRKSGHIKYGKMDKSLFLKYKLIINTTPLGTYPDIDSCPDIPYNYITKSHILIDLVYNPALTLFLKKGKERGALTSNGLRMLHLQAEKSWEIWNS